jgi:hypothetical protein
MALSAEETATLKNLNVGGPANGAPRHGLPSVVVPEIDNWTTQPADELFVMGRTMLGGAAYSKECRARMPGCFRQPGRLNAKRPSRPSNKLD